MGRSGRQVTERWVLIRFFKGLWNEKMQKMLCVESWFISIHTCNKNRASLGSPLSCPTSHMLCVPQGVEACGGKHLGVSQLFIPLGSFYSSDYQFLVYLTFGSRKTRTGEVVLSFIINPFDTQNENATRWQKSSSAPHKMSRNDPSF